MITCDLNYPARTEAFNIKIGLSSSDTIGSSSLRDELPNRRRSVLEMIGSL